MTQSDRIPYPGLRAYETSESDLFFGREDCVDDMLARLAETRFLAVLGNSGSGKSSLVRTGLLDALELGFLSTAPNRWRVADMHPGGRPLHNLAVALLRDSAPDADEIDITLMRSMLASGPRSLIQWCDEGNLDDDEALLLLVDQFEELFRYQDYAGREEAEALVALLLESAKSHPRIHVVLTMRSEYLGACALMRGLAEQINAGLYLTPRMTRDECAAAIEGPARVLGFEVEPRLVNHILNDMAAFAPWDGEDQDNNLVQLARRADQLPLMQHALNRLWETARSENRENPVLRFEDYEKVGGLRGAVNDHAEEVMASLSETAQAQLHVVFKALMSGSNISDAVRSPKPFGDLVELVGDRDLTRQIVDAYRERGCNFLRPPGSVPLDDKTIIDLGHESLIRQWGRLREWLEEENRSVSQWNRLVAAAEAEAAGEGDLLRGLDLDISREWWSRTEPTRVWVKGLGGDYDKAKDFLDRSIAADDARLAEAQEAERQKTRKLRIRAAGYMVIAVAAVGIALFANDARRKAVEATEMAEAATAEAVAATEKAEAATVEADRSRQSAVDARQRAEQSRQSAVEAQLQAEQSETAAEVALASAERSLDLAVDASETFLIDVAQQFESAIGLPESAVQKLMDRAETFFSNLEAEGGDAVDLSASRARFAVFKAGREVGRGNLDAGEAALQEARALIEPRLAGRDQLDEREVEAMLGILMGELSLLSQRNTGEERLAKAQETRAFFEANREALPTERQKLWDLKTLNNLSIAQTAMSDAKLGRETAELCLAEIDTSDVADLQNRKIDCLASLFYTYPAGEYPDDLYDLAEKTLDTVATSERNQDYWDDWIYIKSSMSWDAMASGQMETATEISSEVLYRLDELISAEPLNMVFRERRAHAQYLHIYLLEKQNKGQETYALARKAYSEILETEEGWRRNADLASRFLNLISNISAGADEKPDYSTSPEALDFHARVLADWVNIAQANRVLRPGAICAGCALAPYAYLGDVFENQYSLGSYEALDRHFDLYDEVVRETRIVLENKDDTQQSLSHANRARYWMVVNLPDPTDLSKLEDQDRRKAALIASAERLRAYVEEYPASASLRAQRGWVLSELAQLYFANGEIAKSVAAIADARGMDSIHALRLELEWAENGNGPIPADPVRAQELVEIIGARDWTVASAPVKALRVWEDDDKVDEPKVYVHDRPLGQQMLSLEEALTELRLKGYSLLEGEEERLRNAVDSAIAEGETLVQWMLNRTEPRNIDIYQPTEIAEALIPYETAEDVDGAGALLNDVVSKSENGPAILREAMQAYLLNESGPGYAQRLLFTQQVAYRLWGYRQRPSSVAVIDVILENRDVLSFDKQVQLLNDRGTMKSYMGDLVSAERDYLEALALAPDSPDQLNAVAYNWSEQGKKLPAAQRLLERALTLDPDELTRNHILDSLGWSYVQSGQLEKGLQTLLFIDLKGDSAEAELHFHIGEAYRRMGDMERAKENFDYALTLNPSAEIKSQIDTQYGLIQQ